MFHRRHRHSFPSVLLSLVDSVIQPLRRRQSSALFLPRGIPAHAARAAHPVNQLSQRKPSQIKVAIAAFWVCFRGISDEELRVESRCCTASSRYLQRIDRVFRRGWRNGGRAENEVSAMFNGTADPSGLSYSVRRVCKGERSTDCASSGGVCTNEEREGEGMLVDSAVQQQDICTADVGKGERRVRRRTMRKVRKMIVNATD